jgi:hypothetical protein
MQRFKRSSIPRTGRNWKPLTVPNRPSMDNGWCLMVVHWVNTPKRPDVLSKPRKAYTRSWQDTRTDFAHAVNESTPQSKSLVLRNEEAASPDLAYRASSASQLWPSVEFVLINYCPLDSTVNAQSIADVLFPIILFLVCFKMCRDRCGAVDVGVD